MEWRPPSCSVGPQTLVRLDLRHWLDWTSAIQWVLVFNIVGQEIYYIVIKNKDERMNVENNPFLA
jgi:hypothetical protein